MLQTGLVVACALLIGGADADISLVDHGADFGRGFPVRFAGFEADGAGKASCCCWLTGEGLCGICRRGSKKRKRPGPIWVWRGRRRRQQQPQALLALAPRQTGVASAGFKDSNSRPSPASHWPLINRLIMPPAVQDKRPVAGRVVRSDDPERWRSRAQPLLAVLCYQLRFRYESRPELLPAGVGDDQRLAVGVFIVAGVGAECAAQLADSALRCGYYSARRASMARRQRRYPPPVVAETFQFQQLFGAPAGVVSL